LRGTAFDLFGHTAERRTERQLIADYENLVEEVERRLTPENHALAVALASLPEKIRGFGFIKLRSLEAAKAEEAALVEQFRSGAAPMLKAAE
jgi:indolepyruvate ferredoxin oxidoreductase